MKTREQTLDHAAIASFAVAIVLLIAYGIAVLAGL